MNLIKEYTPTGVPRVIDLAFQLGMTQVPEEITALYTYLYQNTDINHVMEIGSKMGGTFELWCYLAAGKKISVDLPGGGHGGWMMKDHPYLGDPYKKRNKYFKKRYHHVHMITGDSHNNSTFTKVNETLDGDYLDLLFIDGDHTYEGIKADYCMYSSRVKSGGHIVFHDINDTLHHREIDVHVAKFWNELKDSGKGKCIEFNAHKHWAGIGVYQLD